MNNDVKGCSNKQKLYHFNFNFSLSIYISKLEYVILLLYFVLHWFHHNKNLI
jgi:hypothetical protein